MKHGAEQVQIWRRSFDIPPPALEKDRCRAGVKLKPRGCRCISQGQTVAIFEDWMNWLILTSYFFSGSVNI